MKTFSNLKGSAAPAVLGLAMVSAMSTPAFAQDAAAEEDDGNTIVVTGSRIVRPEVASVSPVTAIGAEEIDNSGIVRVEDLVNQLPQAFAAQNAFVSNGASGTATVSLRGLGTNRTLVLIDGRRMQAGDPFAITPDLNTIPAQLVERVEIVTGGASSIYGADAVAGVVNFIMDRDFEGFKVDGNMSFFQHRNTDNALRDLHTRSPAVQPAGRNQIEGFAFDTNVSFGAAFDDGRGHVSAYLGYRQVNAVVQADYDGSNCTLNNSATDPSGFSCGGSTTTPAGRLFVLAPGANGFAAGFGPDFQITGNNFRNRVATDVYNYAPTNYFQRPDKRWTAGFFADYEISDSVKPYAEFQFMDDRSVAQIAFSGTFAANAGPFSCGNAFLSAQQFNVLGCASAADTFSALSLKRMVEGDPRQNDLRHTSYRGVLGVKGDISDNWSYDVYAQRGTTIYQNTYLNDLSVNRINQALNAVLDANGNIVCANPANGCVPLNIFQEGGVTRAAFDFIAIDGLQNADNTQYVVSGYVTGSLGSIMDGSDPIGVVFGAEYRKEKLQLRVDQNFAEGTLAGQGGPTAPVTGQFSVKELFTEIVVPIVNEGFVHKLELEGGYRFSDYTNAGTTHTYKVGLTFAPVEAITFRGVYNRAVRAPNINNLFASATLGLFAGNDPCAGPVVGGTVNGNTAAQCANSGVSAAQFGNIAPNAANQYNQFAGGNPNLDVEKADSFTVGAIIDGNGFGVPGFSATVDYFNIDVSNTIGTVGAQVSLNNCVATGDPVFCNLVNRAPGTGSLWLGTQGFVVNTLQNIGGLRTDGIDFGLNYSHPLGEGSAFIDIVGTYLMSLDTQSRPGLGFYDCVGFYGNVCGSPNPEYRHRMRVGYRSDNGWNLGVTWRYYGSVDYDVLSTDPNLPGSTGVAPGFSDDTIEAYSWFDISGSIDVSENFSFGLGVNNVFDRSPPRISSGNAGGFSNGNTYPGNYDPIGRQFFMRGSLKF